MNKHRGSFLTLALFAAATCVAQSLPEAPIGTPVSAPDIALRAQTTRPDAKGAAAGRGNAQQGRAVYQARCAACHGEKGEGRGDNPALVGSRGTLASDHPLQTVGSFWPYATSVFDYIARAMPYQDPGSLSADEAYAVTAYLLFANGIVGERRMLDARSLPKVAMPNRDGFVADPRPDVAPQG